MLVVVEHGTVETPDELRFDLEALRGRDILELDGAERRCDRRDGVDDPGGIARIDQDRHGSDADQ